MSFSHIVNADRRRLDAAFIACLGFSLLAGLAYWQLLRVLLLPIVLPETVPHVPVLMRFAASSALEPSARKGLAARTPIEATPLNRLTPRTGQWLDSHLSKPRLSSWIHLKPIVPKDSITLPDIKVSPLGKRPVKGRIYSVKPGGHTLVLALLMDSSGTVLQVKIMVQSAYPLMDVNYMLWVLGKTFGSPTPPIAPGKTRWVDMDFYYPHHSVSLP